ncbi:hypothetical protein CCAE64S_01736 [Castellaniella caeni]
MTFSIAARCRETGMVGVAISSSSICVASRCAFVEAGVGAVLSQNVTDPTLGPAALAALRHGSDAQQAVQLIQVDNATIEWRQVLIQPLVGAGAIHSGAHVLGCHAQAYGADCVAAGNLLAVDSIPAAMVAAFQSCSGHLAHRLVCALEAAVRAGGEAGPVHSAGVLVAHEPTWPVVDLRVDYAESCPIAGLRALWTRYAPELDDYVVRATHPERAPSYGVAGDP